MALIICPECGREVSDEAHACHHCGYPIQREKWRREFDEQLKKTVDDFLNKYKDAPFYERLCYPHDSGFYGLSRRGFDLHILDIELQTAAIEIKNCRILGGNIEKKKAKFEKLTHKRSKLVEELTYYNFLDVAEE